MNFQYPALFGLSQENADFLDKLNTDDEKIRFVVLMEIADEECEARLPWLHYALSHDPSALVRVEAAKRLEGWEDLASLTALTDALLDLNVAVIEAATQSLSELKQATSAKILLPLLNREEVTIKIAILRALKPLRDLSAYSAIQKHTEHPDPRVRREAVSSLSWLQQAEAIATLSRIAQHDSDLETRRIATGGLAYCKQQNQAVVVALAQGLKAEDWQLRVEAALTIGKLKLNALEPNLIALLDDLYWQVRIAVVRSLGRLKSQKAFMGLQQNFDYEISNLRKEVALALGEIGGKQALALLQQHAQDSDPEVRKAIRIGLNQIAEGTHAK